MPGMSKSKKSIGTLAGVGFNNLSNEGASLIGLGDQAGGDVGTEERVAFQFLSANGQDITAVVESLFFGGFLHIIGETTGLQPSLAQIAAGQNALGEDVASSGTTMDDLTQSVGLFGPANSFVHVWAHHDLELSRVWYGTVTTGSGGS